MSVTGLVLGGLGLLLLGMALMTDGLKLAAGRSLHSWLRHFTDTPLRGLAAGIGITAAVQSSSAVTMATLGFANAGLLTLERAAWLVYGSNIGTTVTGWLVSLIGLNFKIEAFALPLTGIGVLIRIFWRNERMAAFGTAVAGFGILFLGLGFLKAAFGELGADFEKLTVGAVGAPGLIYGVLLGIFMTVLMQSSSAAIALILTAHAQGLVGETVGAALVVGANIGTTSTAILGALGATANAKRLAALHVAFNIITGIAALLLLGPMLWFIAMLRDWLGETGDTAFTLAIFHTGFNILGVLLIWPISARLTKWLTGYIASSSEMISQPRFLDRSALSLPESGVRAAELELRLVGQHLAEAARQVTGTGKVAKLDRFLNDLRILLRNIDEFLVQLSQTRMAGEAAQSLMYLVTAHSRYGAALRALSILAELRETNAQTSAGVLSAASRACFDNVLRYANPNDAAFSPAAGRAENKAFRQVRSEDRRAWLQRASATEGKVDDVSHALQWITTISQFSNQYSKAARAIERAGRAEGRAEEADTPVADRDAETLETPAGT